MNKIRPILFAIICIALAVSTADLRAQGAKSKQENSRYENEEKEGSEDNNNHSKLQREIFDLSEILPRFFPDENDEERIVSWNKVDEVKGIKWENGLREWTEQTNSISEIIVAKDGIGSPDKGDFSITLSGKKGVDGFSSVSIIFSDVNDECETVLQPNYIFPDHNFESSIIKSSDDCISMHGWNLYEVKFPNKKAVWIKLHASPSSTAVPFYIDVYFNKDEALANW